MDGYALEVRDSSFNRVGLVLPKHTNLTANVPASDVGEWNLQVPLNSPMAEHLAQAGSGIMLSSLEASETVFSGPSTKIGLSYTSTNPQGALIVSGVTDEIILKDSLAWPDPTNANPATQAVARDVRSDEPALVMVGFVDANIGPNATSERRRPKLEFEVGNIRTLDNVEFSARFDELLTLLQSIATSANLMFRVFQRGSALVLRIHETNESRGIRLALTERDLASAETTLEAPGATRVFVGGDGESTSRTFLEYSDDASLEAEEAWGRRIERFAAGTGTTLALQTAGKESLAEDGFAKLTAKFEPTDQLRATYGVDWQLGDVAIVTIGGTDHYAPVSGLVIKADAEGFRMGATVGDVLNTESPVLKRLSHLETYR